MPLLGPTPFDPAVRPGLLIRPLRQRDSRRRSDTHRQPQTNGGNSLTAAANPILLSEDLRGIYRRFYDSVYAITNPGVAAERRALLKAGAQLDAHTLIEPVPPYASSGMNVEAAVEQLDLSKDLTENAARFLSPLMEQRALYTHQWEALRAVHGGQDVVVSGGTGSGKTEAFLLPALLDLVIESEAWGPSGATPVDWWSPGLNFTPARESETGRLPAVRTLVLYPMNALVEDQLVRLRRVLDSDDQLGWLDNNRERHRFFFGRY